MKMRNYKAHIIYMDSQGKTHSQVWSVSFDGQGDATTEFIRKKLRKDDSRLIRVTYLED